MLLQLEIICLVSPVLLHRVDKHGSRITFACRWGSFLIIPLIFVSAVNKLQQRELNCRLCALPAHGPSLSIKSKLNWVTQACEIHYAISSSWVISADDARVFHDWFLNVNQASLWKGKRRAPRRCSSTRGVSDAPVPAVCQVLPTVPSRAKQGGQIRTGARAGVWRFHLCFARRSLLFLVPR